MAGQLTVGAPTRAELEAIAQQYEADGDTESANAAMEMAMEMPEEGAPGAPPPMLARPAGAPPAAAGAAPPTLHFGTNAEANLQAHRQAEAEAMPGWQQAVVGVGQHVDEGLRGGKQLMTALFKGTDSPEYKQSMADEEEARRIDEAVLGTPLGRTGQIAAGLTSLAIPGMGAVKLAKVGGKGLQLGRALMGQGALGAAHGASKPVVEDESRLLNAAAEGGLGVVGAAPVQVLKTAVQLGMKGKTGAILSNLGSKLSGGESAKVDALNAVRDKIGPQIGEITKGHSYKAAALGQHLKQSSDLPPSINAKIKALTNARSRSPVAGGQVQDLREDIGEMERALARRINLGNGTVDDAAAFKALQRARRGLDDGVEANVGGAQSAALRALHKQYRTGIEVPVMLRPRQQDIKDLKQAALPVAGIEGGEYLTDEGPQY